MKKRLMLVLVFVFVLMITGCGNSNIAEEELVDMAALSENGYTAIVWGENTYVPYCAIQRNNCGKQIGFVDGDKDDRVYEYKGFSTGEWLINIYASGIMDGAMLYREINVTDIPDGLVSEYEWNNLSIESVSEELETDNSLISFTEEQIEDAKQAALTYYDDTVFTVNSIEYFDRDLHYGGGEDCCNFTVNVSKDGVVQEPDRIISLKLDNGIWEVVNEGY